MRRQAVQTRIFGEKWKCRGRGVGSAGVPPLLAIWGLLFVSWLKFIPLNSGSLIARRKFTRRAFCDFLRPVSAAMRARHRRKPTAPGLEDKPAEADALVGTSWDALTRFWLRQVLREERQRERSVVGDFAIVGGIERTGEQVALGHACQRG